MPILNHNAETGDVTGWTSEVGQLAVYYDSPPPVTGRFFFYGGSSPLVIASQIIDVSTYATEIDASVTEVKLEWLQASYSSGGDTSACGVRFLDASQTVISESIAVEIIPEPRMTWLPRLHKVTVPVGARYIAVLMRMTRYSGNDNDGYTDDIKLTLYK